MSMINFVGEKISRCYYYLFQFSFWNKLSILLYYFPCSVLLIILIIKLLNYKKKKQVVRPAQKALTVTWADQHGTSTDKHTRLNQVKNRVRHTQKCDRHTLINNHRKNHLQGKPSTSQRIRPQKIPTQSVNMYSRTSRLNQAIQRLFHSTHIF